jgi:hypothetical protein
MKLGPALRQTAFGGVLALLFGTGLSCGHGEPLSGSSTVKSSGTPTTPVIHTANGSAMVVIPSGTLLMGDRKGRPNEAPVHEVKVADFSMDIHEVTQADFARYDLPNPSHFKGPELPVEQVTWPQAAIFCNSRSRAEGLEPCYNEDTAECNFAANGYRLPTEAEWEFACRAGSKTAYSFGADDGQLGRFAWFKRMGPVRHARQRVRVVQRYLRRVLLPEIPVREPDGTGRGQAIRPARRVLGLERRRDPIRVPGGRRLRLFRRMPRSRRDWLPVCPQVRWSLKCQVTSKKRTHGSVTTLQRRPLVPSLLPLPD